MIKILAELAGGDLGLDVAAGRRDNPHVDLNLVGAAHALERLLDQNSQNLVLGLARHVGDLVDKQRAAVRLFQCADLAALPVGHLFHAEQLELHALRHHRRRIDHDERPVGASGLGVDGTRGQLLARARRADDENAAVRG